MKLVSLELRRHVVKLWRVLSGFQEEGLNFLPCDFFFFPFSSSFGFPRFSIPAPSALTRLDHQGAPQDNRGLGDLTQPL